MVHYDLFFLSHQVKPQTALNSRFAGTQRFNTEAFANRGADQIVSEQH